jgi:hypothetical protein
VYGHSAKYCTKGKKKNKEMERAKEEGNRETRGGVGERERRDKCNTRKNGTKKRKERTLEEYGKW